MLVEIYMIWTNGFNNDQGIAMIALIPRNAYFLTDTFSGRQDDFTKHISGVMREFLLQLSRSKLVQYLSASELDILQVQVGQGKCHINTVPH